MSGETLLILPESYAIVRLPAGAPFFAPYQPSVNFFAWVQENECITLVCEAASVPSGAENEPGWRVMKVVGNYDFSIVGILAGISGALAGAGISIFTISTYPTDYILVKSEKLNQSVQALQNAGYHVIDEG